MKSDGEKATLAFNKLLELNSKDNRKTWAARNCNKTTKRGLDADAFRRRTMAKARLARYAKRLVRRYLRENGFPRDIFYI